MRTFRADQNVEQSASEEDTDNGDDKEWRPDLDDKLGNVRTNAPDHPYNLRSVFDMRRCSHAEYYAWANEVLETIDNQSYRVEKTKKSSRRLISDKSSRHTR